MGDAILARYVLKQHRRAVGFHQAVEELGDFKVGGDGLLDAEKFAAFFESDDGVAKGGVDQGGGSRREWLAARSSAGRW
ncbi:hypothetical protein D3C83_132550 [compost metagenome]